MTKHPFGMIFKTAGMDGVPPRLFHYTVRFVEGGCEAEYRRVTEQQVAKIM